jgi:hypothetical protein
LAAWQARPKGVVMVSKAAWQPLSRRNHSALFIELAKTGERNPNILCELALKEIRSYRL